MGVLVGYKNYNLLEITQTKLNCEHFLYKVY